MPNQAVVTCLSVINGTTIRFEVQDTGSRPSFFSCARMAIIIHSVVMFVQVIILLRRREMG